MIPTGERASRRCVPPLTGTAASSRSPIGAQVALSGAPSSVISAPGSREIRTYDWPFASGV